MVTDRVSTAGFLVVLSNLYPDYSFVFIMLLVLDIGSHWFHVMRYVSDRSLISGCVADVSLDRS